MLREKGKNKMKHPVKVLVTAGMIVTSAFLASIVPLPGIQTQDIHVYAVSAETFDKKETELIDKSKDIIKKEAEAWKISLNSGEKAAIEKIFKETDYKVLTTINKELRSGDEYKSGDTIVKIDAALQKAPLTKDTTKMYVDVSLKNDLGISKDEAKVGTVITEKGYTKGSLARNTSATTSEVIELTVPKGERMVNMTPSGNTTLSYNELLERGRSFEITKKTTVIDMGKERTKIEAKLLTTTETLRKYNQELNDELKNSLKLIKTANQPLIELECIDTKNLARSYESAKEIVSAMKNIDGKYLDMINSKSLDISDTPPIRITDDYIDGDQSIEGIHYLEGDHKTIISLENSRNPVHTALHEIGHAVDDMIFFNISLKKEFKDIFEEEKMGFEEDEYGRTDTAEFFAECFALFHSPDSKVVEGAKKRFPKTFDFIVYQLKEQFNNM